MRMHGSPFCRGGRLLPPLRDTKGGYITRRNAATARTVLAGFWRRRLGVQVTSIVTETSAHCLEGTLPQSDAPARARRLLDTLPERYRRILELRFFDALGTKEAARAMGVTVANAKVLQHRALRMVARSGAPEPGR
ncbi:MAG: hypothetical protein E6G66_11495 [Actinobacteria bacterium]|nr:MAG: hypothetical protein E6G66_11495 [Actinomycetota bacterium]